MVDNEKTSSSLSVASSLSVSLYKKVISSFNTPTKHAIRAEKGCQLPPFSSTLEPNMTLGQKEPTKHDIRAEGMSVASPESLMVLHVVIMLVIIRFTILSVFVSNPR